MPGVLAHAKRAGMASARSPPGTSVGTSRRGSDPVSHGCSAVVVTRQGWAFVGLG